MRKAISAFICDQSGEGGPVSLILGIVIAGLLMAAVYVAVKGGFGNIGSSIGGATNRGAGAINNLQ